MIESELSIKIHATSIWRPIVVALQQLQHHQKPIKSIGILIGKALTSSSER